MEGLRLDDAARGPAASRPQTGCQAPLTDGVPGNPHGLRLAVCSPHQHTEPLKVVGQSCRWGQHVLTRSISSEPTMHSMTSCSLARHAAHGMGSASGSSSSSAHAESADTQLQLRIGHEVAVTACMASTDVLAQRGPQSPDAPHWSSLPDPHDVALPGPSRKRRALCKEDLNHTTLHVPEQPPGQAMLPVVDVPPPDYSMEAMDLPLDCADTAQGSPGPGMVAQASSPGTARSTHLHMCGKHISSSTSSLSAAPLTNTQCAPSMQCVSASYPPAYLQAQAPQPPVHGHVLGRCTLRSGSEPAVHAHAPAPAASGAPAAGRTSQPSNTLMAACAAARRQAVIRQLLTPSFCQTDAPHLPHTSEAVHRAPAQLQQQLQQRCVTTGMLDQVWAPPPVAVSLQHTPRSTHSTPLHRLAVSSGPLTSTQAAGQVWQGAFSVALPLSSSQLSAQSAASLLSAQAPVLAGTCPLPASHMAPCGPLVMALQLQQQQQQQQLLQCTQPQPQSQAQQQCFAGTLGCAMSAGTSQSAPPAAWQLAPCLNTLPPTQLPGCNSLHAAVSPHTPASLANSSNTALSEGGACSAHGAADDGERQQLLARISLELAGVLPDQLPPDLRAGLHQLVATSQPDMLHNMLDMAT